MTPDLQVAFLKGGTKVARKSKTDDLSDFAAWRGQAATLGWEHRGVVGPGGGRRSTGPKPGPPAFKPVTRPPCPSSTPNSPAPPC
jgi:hypothetical protein